MSTPTHHYIISGGSEGKSRLNILAGVLHNYTRALFTQQGVAEGMSLLDNGCGGGNVAIMAAGMVGDSGHVTAVDFDADILALAKQDAIEAGIHNITFNAASAYDINYDGTFDVAYARFLLSHLDNPLRALLKMKESVKPGGKIIVEDVQFSGHFCYPANNAFNRFVEYYTVAARHKGADADIGPRLISLFNEAGIKNIGFDVIQPCFNKGDGKWMAYITFNSIKGMLLQDGIADEATINDILQELEEFTKNEQSIICLPRIFRVWGTR